MANPSEQASAPELRYSAKLFGPGFPAEGKTVEEFLAPNDNDAVDHVRSEHLEKSALPDHLENIQLPNPELAPAEYAEAEATAHAAVREHLENTGDKIGLDARLRYGGAYRVEVEALDMSRNFAMVGKKKVSVEGPPGVISTFEVHHEPHRLFARKTRAEQAAREAVHAEHEKHDAALDKLVAAGAVAEAQVAPVRLLPPEARDARKAKRESRIAHHRERVTSSLDQLVADGALSADAAQHLRESVK